VAKASVATNVPESMEFRPIGVIGRPSEAAPALLVASDPAPAMAGHRDERGGKIEIALPNGVRLRVNGLVTEKALSRVLRAVKGAL